MRPPIESDLQLTSGRVHLRRYDGASGGPLLLCIPGLSANAAGFDFLGERLASAGRRVVALDLRGRGRSEVTPPGTYGWPAHAHDVLAVADALTEGAPVDLIGHSMGAYVAMLASALDTDCLRRLVLVDAAGRPEAAAVPPILAALERLGTTVPSVDAHLARVRALGTVAPWSEYWERYFRYELGDAEGGGMRTLTDRDAVLEDARWGGDHDAGDLWPGIRHPTLLVRATQPLGDPGGFVLAAADVPRFLNAVPRSQSVDVDANHYTVITHEDTVTATRRFLEA
ncbi:MAG TPA: alpha/beta fold hydrolase [Candidatus Dormibacteraeota bacterium]